MKTVDFQRPDGRDLKLEVIRYEPQDLSRNRTPDRHRHAFHSIFFFYEGNGAQEIDFETFETTGSDILIIPEGAVHWEQAFSGVRGYVILFTSDFFSDVQQQLLDSFLQYAVALRKLHISLSLEQVEIMIAYCELLYAEQAADDNQNQTFLLQNLMLAFLNKLEGMIQYLPEVGSFISIRRPFQRFVALVEQQYREQQPVEFYAAHLQLTSRKLNDILRKTTGQTASQFIMSRIMVEARRELCYGEKSVKEVAIFLGYENQYYFSRIFKKQIGLSPEQFRQKHAE